MLAPNLAFLAATIAVPMSLVAANNQILGWNNLGMHCMDSDYSVFSILPPYNTIECQLIVSGRLITNGSGYNVTYEAVADPSGSFNSTAIGKGNYFTHAQALYGAAVAPDAGLAGWNMPGVSNVPQSMLFEVTNAPAAGVATPVNWFRAEGIPISPYDDSHNKNPYPMMRLIARSGTSPIATNDIVLPVSDEMDCRACHASGTQSSAQPASGWVWDGLPERDFRLNILRLHDERVFAEQAVLYAAALSVRGFNPQGLYRGVIADGKPVLCAACHASEALGAPSYGTIPALTASIHGFHAHVLDPIANTRLDDSANRSACYRCHPGSTTKCLRGAMGGAIASDGSMAMQCQSCHGNMGTVGSTNRVGWFMEPNCASCHTGTATSNNGQVRYTSVFTDTNGTVRTAADQTFSTQPNVPAIGLSLYRFSAGHGGLQCEACHGSTHAEFPSTHANDNVRNQAMQGHAGVMAECTACHTSMPVSTTSAAGGPHGMHPVGQSWISAHHDYIQGNLARCQACHGSDSRGTVLSRVQGDRTLTASFDGGTVRLNLFRGALIGCYTCHNGPSGDSINNTTPPTVSVVSGNSLNSTPLNLTVSVVPVTASLRIISQPANGSLGVSNNVLSYFPNPGFTGTDTFTYAAWDGSKNSTLATGTVAVAQGPYSLGIASCVPASYPAGWPVAFVVIPAVTNSSSAVIVDWEFGDGLPHSTGQYAQHVYSKPGTYNWMVSATVGTVSATNIGTITIDSPIALGVVMGNNSVSLSWPRSTSDVVIQQSDMIGTDAQWLVVTNLPLAGPNGLIINVPNSGGTRFFRARQPW
ncbi:MAG TPA: Ig-like domain-containing protein [Verrucomicrobiae bacterium]|nr:Ig-like domain-containing protein [Verrucomicrobiae bacterium]